MKYRFASADDVSALGRLNADLIRDEGHRNPMTLAELEDRMHGWLEGEYEAAMCESDGTPVGYALYRREPDHVYLRQLFVREADRRRGIATELLQWLWSEAWAGVERVRVDVLIGNPAALAFWRAVGFSDYCVTLEMSSSGGTDTHSCSPADRRSTSTPVRLSSPWQRWPHASDSQAPSERRLSGRQCPPE